MERVTGDIVLLSPTACRAHTPSFGVKDINFERGQLTVRDGKRGKDRVTMLPAAMKGPLREHLTRVKAQHEGCSGRPSECRAALDGRSDGDYRLRDIVAEALRRWVPYVISPAHSSHAERLPEIRARTP